MWLMLKLFVHALTDYLISSSQVLGYYNRRGINPEAFLNEIKYIASDPDDKHFFNVTDESALKDIVDALGERIFSLEGLAKESFDLHPSHSIGRYAEMQNRYRGGIGAWSGLSWGQ